MKRTEFDEWLLRPEKVFGTFGAPTSPFAACSVNNKGYEDEAITTHESPFLFLYFLSFFFFLILIFIFIFYSYLNETWMVGGSFL